MSDDIEKRYRDYESMVVYPEIKMVDKAAQRVRHMNTVFGGCDFIELTFEQENDMANAIQPEALKRLAFPFLDGGTKTIYFAVVENRIYCGKVPANRIEGKPDHEQPFNVEFHEGQSFVDLAETLEVKRT